MAIIDNLVAYWSLANVNDAHGSNTLTNNGTVTFVAGKVGNAADCESGSSQYLSIIDNAALSMGDIDCTFAGWVRFESAPTAGTFTMTVLAKCNLSDNQREYLLDWEQSANRLRVQISGDGTATTTLVANTLGIPQLATWYFIVWKHDSVNNQIIMKINDVAETPVAHTTGIHNGTSTFALGALIRSAATDRFMDGLLDEWGIWKRKTTDAEDTWLYNSGTGRSYAEIVAGIPAGGSLRPRIFGKFIRSSS